MFINSFFFSFYLFSLPGTLLFAGSRTPRNMWQVVSVGSLRMEMHRALQPTLIYIEIGAFVQFLPFPPILYEVVVTE